MELSTPFAMLVAASSKSGKTHLVRDVLLNHVFMFEQPLTEILWIYHKGSRDDALFESLKNSLRIPISFMDEFPKDDASFSDRMLFNNTDTSKLKCLVLDDVVHDALKSQNFLELFTILSHHQNIAVIAILQNLQTHTSSNQQVMNNIIRNVTYIVMFPDRRQMNACKQVARGYYPGEEDKLVKPFKHLVESKSKYTYMLIDFNDDDVPVKFNCLRQDDEAFTVNKEGKKAPLQFESFAERMKRRLQPFTNDDGNFVYPGNEDQDERTGSNLGQLLDYAFRVTNERPIDYKVFREFVLEHYRLHQRKIK